MSAVRALALRGLGLSPLLALSACDDSTPALRVYPTFDACLVDFSAAVRILKTLNSGIG